MLQALIAAFFGSGGDITNKYLLGKLKLPHKDYLPFVFTALAVISLFLIPVNFHFDAGSALTFKAIFVFLFMVGCAAAWNTMLAKSLKVEPLHEYETIILMAPIVTVILAGIFLPSERNLHVFVAGLVSSAVLLIARVKKHHLNFSASAKRTFLAVVLIALESISLKYLLNFYSPPFLYFIRVVILAVIFNNIYKPDYQLLKLKPIWRGILISACFGTGVMVLKYYAFAKIGVVATTIILLLSPMLTFVGSYFYFKEHRNFKRDAICALVVIGCIVYSTVVK